MNLAGKNIWVIGASMGIGHALVKELDSYTTNLVISSRKEDLLKKLATEINLPEENVIPFDITNHDEAKEAVYKVLQLMGSIDCIIFTAGVSQRSLITDTQLFVYDKLMNLNFLSIVNIALTILPSMIEKKSGYFVVLSSVAGKFGTPNRSGYAASKNALHGFFESLRAEHMKDNISVTLVCPGFINTDITIRSLTGNGEPYQRIDSELEHGIPVDLCARKIVKAIISEKREIYPGGNREVIGVYLNRFFPRLLQYIVALKGN
ncbi:SDR family NAD(P)-dependent oxidoreductase [Photorhabdus antumapuensis]|uniref:SDR family NAD(P)-dependent oxidoreductase n=1 Tax=Photorhabdus antumapuensis TaxID=2862867 RepID=UPI001CECE811|nr:SDR family NAD(P)-dependent oxidoreductase [Photorhabdus antumapuensis]MCA6220889.1 SDR family NAD(P)-dependent oxidoreductase [Photorhabdus antumapuensis]